MAETRHIMIYYEGDDDRAVLEKLRAAKLLPEGCDLAKRSKQDHPGKDGLVRQLLPFVRPANGVGGRAVVILDLDEMTFEQRGSWFRSQLQQELDAHSPTVKIEDAAPPNERVRLYHLAAEGKIGRIALVPAGLPGDDVLATTYGIDRFAMDDWLFRLVLDARVFGAVSDLKAVPYATAKAKFIEVAELFRKNDIEVRKAKTYVQILRALAAIAPSTATIVGRFVEKGAQALSPEEFRATLHPLLDDLEVAIRVLSAT